MSTDAHVTRHLMETLEDGRQGFSAAADKLATSTRPELANEFRTFAGQRARFFSELETLAAAYGDDLDESGSVAGTAHRVWMSVKDALTGDDPGAVLDAAGTGEEHAVGAFEEALTEDISAGLRTVVDRQLHEIRQARRRVDALRQAA